VATTEWKAQTLGQNKTIADIAAAAEKASSLVTINVELASTALKTAGIFLTGLLSPYILLLRVTADAIDDFVVDFRDIGFFVLEVTDVEGGYVIPEDVDGNPIALLMSPVAVAANMAVAVSAGQTKEFGLWAKEFLGEEDIYLTGAQKAEYQIETGKALPEDKLEDNANDNRLGTLDGVTGLYKMTPSQVIATIVGAMDDELDLRRPKFSASAEAGAVIVLVGVSDLTKNLANLKSIVSAFNLFFGGDEQKDKEGNVIAPGGVASGMAKLGGLINAALLQVEDPDKNNVKLKVNNICTVRGTEEDKTRLNRSIPSLPYITSGQFKVNDYVVGPRVKFGARCMGYVSVAGEPVAMADDLDTDFDESIYVTQELTITGITNLDAIGWRNLSSGAKLQKVAFVEKYNNFVDQNTGLAQTTGPFNDFEYLPNLTSTDAKSAKTKVQRESGKTLLTSMSTEDITEEHTAQSHHGNDFKFTTHNVTVGDIFEEKTPQAPHPNFKAVKLDDLIGDFKTFFAAIDALTDSLRKMADDAAKALDDIIAYLDAKIAELEEIAAALQKILALFTTGLGDAGVYVLSIPVAIGGNDYIKSELQGAANRPPDTLDFTLAFMMMGGGTAGTEKGFKTLQKLLVP
jgi:hypothetical protein